MIEKQKFRALKKESLWVLSNLTAGTDKQVESMIHGIPDFVNILMNAVSQGGIDLRGEVNYDFFLISWIIFLCMCHQCFIIFSFLLHGLLTRFLSIRMYLM